MPLEAGVSGAGEAAWYVRSGSGVRAGALFRCAQYSEFGLY